MFKRFAGTSFVLALAIQLGASGSALAFVPWSNPNGSAAFWSWSGGGSDNGLFGSPVLVNDTFVFTPSAFRAQSVNGVPAITADRLQVDIHANPNYFITGIRITEFGDYGIFTQGSVSASGNLFLTDLDNTEPNGDPRVRTNALVTTPPSPITSGSGEWTAVTEIMLDFENPVWTNLRLVLNNNLVALSAPGNVTFIEKKVVGAGIRIEIIPEPSALALLLLGGLTALRRR